MISHELANKLLQGPDLRVMIPKLSESKDIVSLKNFSYGGKGIPKEDVS